MSVKQKGEKVETAGGSQTDKMPTLQTFTRKSARNEVTMHLPFVCVVQVKKTKQKTIDKPKLRRPK